MNTTLFFDTSKFNEALREYMRVSSRTLQQAINTKAYYVARKATLYTHKADPTKIQSQLGGYIRVAHTTKTGRTVMRRKLSLTPSRDDAMAPLAALIVNKRRGSKGLPGLQGSAMAAAIRNLIAARLRSVAFIKSGWLEAIRTLASLADRKGQPPIDNMARQYGAAKGSATPAAAGGDVMIATILNAAVAKKGEGGFDALRRFGEAGLAMAFADEVQSMQEYIERKMQPDAERTNRKLR
jgi:hypothetical protein